MVFQKNRMHFLTTDILRYPFLKIQGVEFVQMRIYTYIIDVYIILLYFLVDLISKHII